MPYLPGRSVDQPPPSSFKIKDRGQVYIYTPCAFTACYVGELYFVHGYKVCFLLTNEAHNVGNVQNFFNVKPKACGTYSCPCAASYQHRNDAHSIISHTGVRP
jgi:hypothetical protein